MRSDDYYENQAQEAHVAPLVERLRVAVHEFEALKEEIDTLNMKISAEFPEGAGEYTKSFGPYTVVCKRDERWSWDKDILEGIYNASPNLPDHIKKTYSVDKRRFKTLSEDEQAQLLPALERKPIKAKLDIKD